MIRRPPAPAECPKGGREILDPRPWSQDVSGAIMAGMEVAKARLHEHLQSLVARELRGSGRRRGDRGAGARALPIHALHRRPRRARAWINGRELGGTAARCEHLAASHD
jgi:hypothetical protein